MFGRRTRLGARRRRRMGPRIARLFGGPRPRRSDRSGVDEPASWQSRRSVQTAALITGIVAFAFILWIGWVVYLYAIRHGPSGVSFAPAQPCRALGLLCPVATKNTPSRAAAPHA